MTKTAFKFWLSFAVAGLPIAIIGMFLGSVPVFSIGYGIFFVIGVCTLAIAYEQNPPDEY